MNKARAFNPFLCLKADKLMALETKHAKGSLGHLLAPFSDLTGTMGTLPPRSLSVSDEAWLVFDAFDEPYRDVSEGINLVKRC
ncbi:hypothetical protein RB2150_17624 [Rhodobacterales bacterium HTCC2150]|nr:hypothetical protein RB2150_17624 [Rhodobacterales bacterium HTCC2150] [Rhodobacteraceae bacterium HTCC2150]